MATSYYLCCPDEKLAVEVGQRRFGTEFYVYSECATTMENLEVFLLRTKGKSLVFVDDLCQEDWWFQCECIS